MKNFELWLVAAALSISLLLVAMIVVFLAHLFTWAPLALVLIAVAVFFRYTMAKDIFNYIKEKIC